MRTIRGATGMYSNGNINKATSLLRLLEFDPLLNSDAYHIGLQGRVRIVQTRIYKGRPCDRMEIYLKFQSSYIAR